WEEPVDEFRHADLLGGDDDIWDIEADDNPAEVVGRPDFICPGAEEDEVTYEELLKHCVEQLVVSSRAYTQETALSRRVKDWKDQVWPKLQMQEERPPLDIHDYSQRIVTELGCVGH
ncbi:condensin-2 complex subunit H2, partial [Austrofundulus limnaeus]